MREGGFPERQEGHPMRKIGILCAVILCAATVALAQDQPGNSTPGAPPAAAAPAATPRPSPLSSAPSRWQLGISYEYFRFRSAGSTTNLNGFNGSLTYFMNDWFGIEADGAGLFGSLSPTIKAKIAWYGGGAHLAYRQHERLQPWVHALIGGARLNITQTVGPSTFNGLSVVTGGGVDMMMSPRLGFRGQADFNGTRFVGTWQKNFQVKAGIVLNF
jgi:hypothetical protein